MPGILPLQNNLQSFPINAAAFPEQKRPLVLIAEGDTDNRTELKALLDLYGISVLEAENGEEAIDLVVRQCPNLVLINARLPLLDGYETARLIRNIKSFDRMPIIFHSDETERVFRKRAFAVGGDGYHIAPLDIDRLDLILENFLFCSSEMRRI
jgi:CheY-like chemotaxis protein